jgi:hypothetical protein
VARCDSLATLPGLDDVSAAWILPAVFAAIIHRSGAALVEEPATIRDCCSQAATGFWMRWLNTGRICRFEEGGR